jgi:CO/xanthine dehydrogenase Mo-binding subunit
VARLELPVAEVRLLAPDIAVGPSGSSSASRQTYMTGGAVHLACQAVRDELFARARTRAQEPGELTLTPEGVASESRLVATYAELLGSGDVTKTVAFHHKQTYALDADTGQGDAFVSFMLAGHRAVVDVDTELGITRVVEMASVQDVGCAVDTVAVEGQIEGGTAQGLGLAIMEELHVEGGHVLNPSFTDYLIPTIVDMPPVVTEVLEYADPDAPLGIKGAGEASAVSSGAAVLAAVENAIGARLGRVPVRPEDIVWPERQAAFADRAPVERRRAITLQ